jgi:hypothetical protein
MKIVYRFIPLGRKRGNADGKGDAARQRRQGFPKKNGIRWPEKCMIRKIFNR